MLLVLGAIDLDAFRLLSVSLKLFAKDTCDDNFLYQYRHIYQMLSV